jgi:hypothetical protein
MTRQGAWQANGMGHSRRCFKGQAAATARLPRLAQSLSWRLGRALLLGRPRLLGIVRIGGVASQPKRPQPRRLFAHGILLGLVFGHCFLGLTQLLLLLEQRFGAAVRLIGIHAQYRTPSVNDDGGFRFGRLELRADQAEVVAGAFSLAGKFGHQPCE